MSIHFDFGALTVNDIVTFTKGEVHYFGCDGSAPVTSYSTDSREVDALGLFAAIVGERVDGHNYIASAREKGASCILCERIPDALPETGYAYALVRVENTVTAVGDITHGYKKLSEHKTVAITGSVGKTTTKEFVYAVLSEKIQNSQIER